MLGLRGDQVCEALERLAPAWFWPRPASPGGVVCRTVTFVLPPSSANVTMVTSSPAGQVFEDGGEDDALVPDDLAVHAVERIVLAAGPAHHEA